MAIKLISNLFEDFSSLDLLDSNINNDKIILNNNLIIDSEFINNGELVIRGSIIFNGGKLINNGNIYLIKRRSLEFIIPYDISGNNKFTGITMYSDISSDVYVKVSGPSNTSINWGINFKFKTGKDVPFYFSNDGGLTAKDRIEVGDGLYWNESYSKIKLYRDWKIIFQIL